MNIETGLLKVSREESVKILREVEEFKTPERNEWIRDCIENGEFEIGKQWSEEEIAANEERGNYVITINVLERVLEYLTGMLTAKLPEYAIFPKNKSKESCVKLAKKMISWAFEESRGLRRFRKFVHDGLTDNISYLYVYVDDDDVVKFTNLRFNEVLIDPASKDFMFDDAKAIYIHKRIRVAEAKLLYGIDDFQTGFPEEWSNININFGASNVIPGDTDEKYNYSNTKIRPLFNNNNTEMDVYEGFRRHKIKENGKVRKVIFKETLLGYDHVLRERMPDAITHIPIVSFFYKDTANPYKLGKVHLVKEIQRFLNKIHGIILKNTLTLGMPKLAIESQAIPHGNMDALKRSISDPNDIVILNPSMDNHKAWDIIQGTPTPSAPMDLYMNAMRIMEMNTAPSEMVGMSNSSSPESAAAAVFQKENVLDSFKTMAGILEDAGERLGEIILQYQKAYVTEDMVVYMNDGEKIMQELKLNKQHKVDFNNPESIEGFKKKMAESGMSRSEIEYTLNTMKEVEDDANSIREYIENNTSELNVFVKVVPGSYASMFDSIKFQMLTMLVQMGSLHPSVLIDYAPLDDREKIKKQSQGIESAFAEMADMQKALEEMQKEVEKVTGENINIKKNMEETKNKVRMDYLYKDARVKESDSKKKLQQQINSIKENTKLNAKEVLLQLKELIMDMEKENIQVDDSEYEAMVNAVEEIIHNKL